VFRTRVIVVPKRLRLQKPEARTGKQVRPKQAEVYFRAARANGEFFSAIKRPKLHDKSRGQGVPNAKISRTICELLEWKRANGGLTISAGNCWNDCRSKAGCDFRRCGVSQPKQQRTAKPMPGIG